MVLWQPYSHNTHWLLRDGTEREKSISRVRRDSLPKKWEVFLEGIWADSILIAYGFCDGEKMYKIIGTFLHLFGGKVWTFRPVNNIPRTVGIEHEKKTPKCTHICTARLSVRGTNHSKEYETYSIYYILYVFFIYVFFICVFFILHETDRNSRNHHQTKASKFQGRIFGCQVLKLKPNFYDFLSRYNTHIYIIYTYINYVYHVYILHPCIYIWSCCVQLFNIFKVTNTKVVTFWDFVIKRFQVFNFSSGIKHISISFWSSESSLWGCWCDDLNHEESDPHFFHH